MKTLTASEMVQKWLDSKYENDLLTIYSDSAIIAPADAKRQTSAIFNINSDTALWCVNYTYYQLVWRLPDGAPFLKVATIEDEAPYTLFSFFMPPTYQEFEDLMRILDKF